MAPTGHLYITGKNSPYETLLQWWDGPHGGEWREVTESDSTRVPQPPFGLRGHWEFEAEKTTKPAPTPKPTPQAPNAEVDRLDTHLHNLLAQFIKTLNQSERNRLEREALKHMRGTGKHDDAYRDWCNLLKWFSK